MPKSSTAVQLTISVLPVSVIDLDLADVAAGRESEVGRVVKRGLLQARLELRAGELVRDIGVERDVAPGRRLVGAGDGELAVLEFDVALGRLQHEGRDFLGLGLDLVERLDDRRHADRAGARAVGAHAELHLVGVAMHDRDILDRNAEPLGHELREGGLVALPVAWQPVSTSTEPVGLTRTSADSHRPTPAPSEPTAWHGAMPQASI